MRWIYRILLVIAIIALPILLIGASMHLPESRITKAITSPQETIMSATERLRQWKFAAVHGWERPILGHAVGSFAMDLFHLDQRMFPHNFILEAFYEQGLIGVGILVAFLIVPFRRYFSWRRIARSTGVQTAGANMWFAISISSLIAVFVHWDVADIRLVWFCLAMLVTQCALSRRNLQEEFERDFYLNNALSASR